MKSPNAYHSDVFFQLVFCYELLKCELFEKKKGVQLLGEKRIIATFQCLTVYVKYEPQKGTEWFKIKAVFDLILD